MKSKQFFLLLFFSVQTGSLQQGCGNNPVDSNDPVAYEYQVPEQIDDGWQTAHLSEFGIDTLAITEVVKQILDGTYINIHSILLVKSGKLVLEEYFPGRTVLDQYVNFERNTLHNVHSVTKSFTSALIGIALDQGLIVGVDEKISTYLPQYSDLFEAESKNDLSIRHLLTMSSGIQWDERRYSYNDSRNDHSKMDRSGDPVLFVLDRPFATEPGSRFEYNSGLSITLGEIVYGASGLRLDKFAEQHLFMPLGITKYNWVKYGNGTVQAGGGLNLRPRDMAKFGQLFLNGGVWDSQRIISEEWTRESTQQQPPNEHYGYQWWLRTFSLFTANNEEIEFYSADGRGGQNITVAPELDLVVVFTGGNDNDLGAQPYPIMRFQIFPAVVSAMTNE